MTEPLLPTDPAVIQAALSTLTTGHVRAAILANETLPPRARLNSHELANNLGTTSDAIRSMKKKLRKQGYLAPVGSEETRPPVAAPPRSLAPAATLDSDNLLDTIKQAHGGAVLTDAEIDLDLSFLARNAHEAVRVAAYKLLDFRRRGLSTSVGPPAPADDKETIDRLIRMLLPIDPKVVVAALRRLPQAAKFAALLALPRDVDTPPPDMSLETENSDTLDSDVVPSDTSSLDNPVTEGV